MDIKPTPLQGKTALVSGASGGIGGAIAFALASVGVRVCISGKTPARLSRRREELLAAGIDADALLDVAADLSHPPNAQALVQATLGHFGQLDILVNAAGSGAFEAFDKLSIERIDQVIGSNLLATIYLCHAATPALIQSHGQLINISSGLGKRGSAKATAYCAAKFGVQGFTEALRLDLARHGVRVCAISPAGAGVNTPFWACTPARAKPERMLAPQRIAEAVLMVLSSRENASIDELILRSI